MLDIHVLVKSQLKKGRPLERKPRSVNPYKIKDQANDRENRRPLRLPGKSPWRLRLRTRPCLVANRAMELSRLKSASFPRPHVCGIRARGLSGVQSEVELRAVRIIEWLDITLRHTNFDLKGLFGRFTADTG